MADPLDEIAKVAAGRILRRQQKTLKAMRAVRAKAEARMDEVTALHTARMIAIAEGAERRLDEWDKESP